MRRPSSWALAVGLGLAAAGAAGAGLLADPPAAYGQLSDAQGVPAEAWAEVNRAYREKRMWDALGQLRQLEAQLPQSEQVQLMLVRVLEEMGAYHQAAWHVEQLTTPAGGRASYELESARKRLAYKGQQGNLDQDRRVGRLKLALGMVDLDPAQAFSLLKEISDEIAAFDDASVDLLIRELEVLGYVDQALLAAERAALVASSPQERQAAQERVGEVHFRAARSKLVQGRVTFPGGEIKLGTTRGQWRRAGKRDIDRDEVPAHKAILGPYALATHEVTAQSYRRCQSEGACPPPRISVTPLDPLEPMVGVSWEAAAAYCRAVGGRLPTEAEWEAAARGPEGRMWPWGDEAPTCQRAHYRGCELVVGSRTFSQGPSPVGMHEAGATPEGLQDLAGNVAEWVQDGYDAEGYGDLDKEDPRGPEGADLRVDRGGSYDRKPHELRGARREARVPSQGYPDVGFRCAWDVAVNAP